MLEDVVTFFIEIMLELIPLFLVVTFLIGLSLEYISPDKLHRYLGGKRRLHGTVLATILGYVTPFCSCSTVPVAAGMLGAAIPLGLVVAFVFASPYPIEIGAIVLGPVFGWHLAIIFSVVGLVIALAMGLLVDKLDWSNQISSGFKQLVYPRIRNRTNETENVVQSASCGCDSLESDPNQCDCSPIANVQECECENLTTEGNLVAVLKNAMRYSLGFLKKLFPYILVGSLAGALIYGYMPEEIILQYAG
ncbi:MAG: permease, partial [Candidatus Bathyarchaeota archaeon]